MNILVIEDEEYKLNDILKALNEDFDSPKIMTASSRNEGFLTLRSNQFDLIILDWNFPRLNGEFPETSMGAEFLFLMKRYGINIPVIICSSMHIDCEHPNVIGIVEYDPSVVLSFREFMGKDR